MAPAEDGGVDIEVVYCAAPGQTDLLSLRMPPGATVDDALAASGLRQRHALEDAGLHVGIWSRLVPTSTPLRDRDRVEVYRPLTVDPKEARRLRYKGAKKSGAKRPLPT